MVSKILIGFVALASLTASAVPGTAPRFVPKVAPASLAPVTNHGPSQWNVVVESKPAPANEKDRASALPADANDWTKFNRWARPKIFTAKLYHFEEAFPVAEFTYQVVLLHGGAPIGKAGAYIGYAAITAKDVSILKATPGAEYKLNSTVAVKAVRNVGSAEAPVAEMELELISGFSVKRTDGSSSTEVRSVTYRVDGNGKIDKIKSTDGGFRLFRSGKPDEVAQAEAACPHPINEGGYMGLSELLIRNGPIQLVKNNKLMDHKNAPLAKALPPGVGCWNQVKGWKTYRRGFEYRWNNPLWWDFVVKGEIVWIANGSDLRGRGNYIGFATVNINEVSRGIIRSVDISASAPREMVHNVGTDKEPVPQITFVLRSEARTKLSTEVSNWVISIDGHGNLSDVLRQSLVSK